MIWFIHGLKAGGWFWEVRRLLTGEEEREWFEKAQGLLGSGNVPFLDMAVVIHMSLSHSLGHTF